MAFKNGAANVSTTRRTLYTVPAGQEAVVHSIFLANVEPNNETVNATIEFFDGSAYFKIGNNLPVPAQSTLVFDKPVNLTAGDSITVVGDKVNGLTCFISILEQALPV